MTDSLTNKDKWLITGYKQFGYVGPESLNVERLSMVVGLNRSSFYHHFGEVELFEQGLLNRHVERFKVMAIAAKDCSTFDPEVLELVPAFRDEISFHRQLLIHRIVPRYLECFNQAKSHTEETIYKLWTAHEDAKKDSEEFSLYTVVRDYFLVHFDQGDTEMVSKTLQDVHMMLHSHSVKIISP